MRSIVGRLTMRPAGENLGRPNTISGLWWLPPTSDEILSRSRDYSVRKIRLKPVGSYLNRSAVLLGCKDEHVLRLVGVAAGQQPLRRLGEIKVGCNADCKERQ